MKNTVTREGRKIKWRGEPGALRHAGFVVFCAVLDWDECLRAQGIVAETQSEATAMAVDNLGWRDRNPYGWLCPECVKALEDIS